LIVRFKYLIVHTPNGLNIQIRSIADGVMHPAYQPPSASALGFCDAAIITVDRPFIFNDFVKKIKLPPHEYDPKGKIFHTVVILNDYFALIKNKILLAFVIANIEGKKIQKSYLF